MSKNSNPLKNEELRIKILKLYDEGCGPVEIGRKFGISHNTISDFLNRKTYRVWTEDYMALPKDTAPRDNKETHKNIVYPEPIKIVTSEYVKPNCTHAVIPDTQTKEGIDLDYCRWIGEYLADKRPDVIVHGGDHWDMPSLSSYDKGTKKAEGRRLHEDIAVGIKAMNMILKPIAEIQEKELKEFGEVLYKPKMIFTMGNHECLVPETEVLTERGFIPIPEVTTEDIVLTMDSLGNSEWQKVNGLVVKDFDGDLLEWESNSMSVSCTPKHRMYYATATGKMKVKLAEEMKPNFKVYSSCINKAEETVDLSDEELSLIAWLNTDSHFSTKNVTLYQRQSNAHKIEDLLVLLNIPYKKTIRSRDIKQICGHTLKKKPEASVEFCINKENINHLNIDSNKVLPVWIKNLSARQWDIYLDTLIDADGSVPTKAKSSRVFYGKKQICDDVQAAAVANGWSASLTEYRHNQWRVNLNKRQIRKLENKIPNKRSYKGLVFCLVTDNSNFMIRYKNKCHITGNCRLMRHVNANPELEGFVSYENFKLKDNGWEVYDFLEPARVHGVNYIHYVPNPMTGKPMGGSALNILNKTGESFTMFHVQKLDYAIKNLLFSGRHQKGIVAGACYPHNEGYKGYTGNNHWRGMIIKHNVKDGDYEPTFVKLSYLEDRYGRKE